MVAHVMIVGGGYAGVLAATRIARQAGPLARVTLVNPRPEFVERIRLHQVAAGSAPRRWDIASLLKPSGAELRIGSVRAVELAQRKVELDGEAVSVDHLVLAAGSAPVRREGAFTLGSVEEAQALRAAATRTGKLTVVGGGLTGIEAVSELVDGIPGLKAVLVCRGELGAGALGPAAVRHVRAALEARGVEVREHTSVDAVDDSTVLWAGGFSASQLAAQTGLACDSAGRLLLTSTLQAPGHDWLWGAGDAAVPQAGVGAPLHMSCKIAMAMARQTADNLVHALRGEASSPFRFGDSGVCVSLGRRDGVIQQRTENGEPAGVIRGQLAAWLKESVCRFTLRAIRFPVMQGAFSNYDRRGRVALERAARPVLSSGAL